MTLYIVMYAGIGLLLMGLGIPFIREKVGPNDWAGFRIPATLDHPEIWYPANRYAGRWMFALGVLNFALAIILGVLPGITEIGYLVLMTAFLLGGLGVGLVFCWKHANRLLKHQN